MVTRHREISWQFPDDLQHFWDMLSSKIPYLFLTAGKIPDISRFSRQVVTLCLRSYLNLTILTRTKATKQLCTILLSKWHELLVHLHSFSVLHSTTPSSCSYVYIHITSRLEMTWKKFAVIHCQAIYSHSYFVTHPLSYSHTLSMYFIHRLDNIK